MNVYECLDNAFYLYGDRPLSVLSDNKNGAVALAFTTSDYALKFINENIEAIISRKVEKPEIKPISSSFDFMELCAKHGYAGIELLSEENQISIVFCVRLEEASSLFPTAMTFNRDGISHIKTRYKYFEEITYRTIKEWQRFDILDKVSAKFVVNNPFRNWGHKSLFEIRTRNDEFLSLFRVPCRHNYNSLDGSIPFFTTLKLAIDFLNNLEFRNHLMFFGGFKSNYNEIAMDLSSSTNLFKIVVLDDVRERIREINNPFMGFVINPNGHRDSTGYGSLSVGDKNYEPLFYGVSGTWKINSGNEFVRIEQRDSWDGTDSFYWNHINGYKLSPLDRSFSSESTFTRLSELTEHDIEDFVQSNFEDKEYTDDEVFQDHWTNLEEEKIKQYCVIWWDAVTGDGKDNPMFFNSILDLIIWLWQYECNRDYPIRRDGAHQCNGFIGVPESTDREYAKLIHDKIREQLVRIFKRISLKGYKPSDGDDLSGLVNSYLRTIHIDLLGHTKDVLFQLDDSEMDEVADLLDFSNDFLESEFSDSYNQLDELGATQGKKILGEIVWIKLSSRAKYFISSSLSQLSILGISPQLDYSLISIGFVKALEYELGLLFKNFALTTDLKNIIYDENDYGERALVEISINQGRKPLTLGEMGHLINPNKRLKSQLRVKLGEYIDSLVCGPFLNSKKFWKEGIFKITKKYRNGGAHDTAIPMETALECMKFIIGNEECEGVLKKIIA
ncbi:MAG: hypothetical protein FJX80_08805 [Bacteroidetes bacterium]|nr:hypothetical protein [Bacteroidota bacterium]